LRAILFEGWASLGEETGTYKISLTLNCEVVSEEKAALVKKIS
jgi:hypothetical protein